MARYALVIGIGEYQNSSFANLSKATNDAEAVARVLEQYGDFQAVERLPKRWNPDKNDFEVARQKVTGAELRQGIKTFLLEQAANNEALIYFTGHGLTVADGFGKPKGYLAASDCEVKLVDKQIVYQKNGVDFIGFNDLIQESTLSSLVVLLDCCHSGNFLESSMVRQTMTAFSSETNYYLITACRSYEEALALKTDEYSIFTGAILKGLARENANKKGEVSGDRLFDYISSEVKATLQEPIHLGWGRSVKLVTYRGEDIALEEVTKNRANPYLGLCSFEQEQEKYFCGRETAIRLLLERLSEGRFLAAIGPSGCGKSSLIKAGLLPQLMRDRIHNSSQWGIERFTPGKHPRSTLVEILEQHQQNQPFVLFIDQFEEVFTLCENEAERQSFIQLIADEATDINKQTRVIVAIRTDFLDRCAAYPAAAKLINRNQPTTYVVTPLSREGIEEAIETPAKLHGATFERGLVSQIADDVDEQPGALPLLQYALKELWRVCIEESGTGELLLTKKGYEQIGGVKGALEKQANIVYKGFVASDQTFVRQLFIELVQLGERTEVTRRRVRWERLEAIADSINQLRTVVGQLADRRLIVTDEQTVEVAHEALLSEWSLLRNWIEEDRESIRLRRRLEEYCREWQETFQKSDDALMTGARLAAIVEWKDKTQPKLIAEEEEFLKQSLERRDREIREQLEQERQLRELAESRRQEAEARAIAEIERALAAEDKVKAEAERSKEAEARVRVQTQRTRLAIAAGVLVTFTLGLGLLSQKLALERKQRESIAILASISKAQQLFETNNQLEALIASIQALKDLDQIGIENTQIINNIKALIGQVRERNRLEGHTLPVNSVSFSPNPKDKLIASASSDRTIKLWKTDGRLWKTLTGHTGKVVTVTFSSDGQYIASASADKTIKIWKKDGTLVTTLKGHQDAVYHVSFSPDGNAIASASTDKTVRLWNWKQNNSTPKIITGHKQAVNSVVFSKNGQLIASASDDGTIKIWKYDGELLKSIADQTPVRFASFGSDNQTLASVNDNNTAKLLQLKFDSKTRKIVDIQSKIIAKDNDRSQMITFSPNGKIIASTNADGSIKFWNYDGTRLITIAGHKGQINDLSFNDDSNILASASRDKTVRLWSLDNDSNTNMPTNVKGLIKTSCNYIKDYLSNNHNAKKNNKYLCDS